MVHEDCVNSLDQINEHYRLHNKDTFIVSSLASLVLAGTLFFVSYNHILPEGSRGHKTLSRISQVPRAIYDSVSDYFGNRR
jgi:hypothetical protein